MTWQDRVISIGQILLAIGLIPIIISPAAVVPIYSSILTATVLSSFVIAFSSLKMKTSSLTSAISVVAWVFIAIFRNGA